MGKLTPEDEAIWRRITRTVRPIRTAHATVTKDAKVDRGKAPPESASSAKPSASMQPTARTQPKEIGSHARSGPIDAGRDRTVRRGRIDVSTRLDLHGMTQDVARDAVHRFLTAAQKRGVKTTLVITGKGVQTNTAGRGVLRAKFGDWLKAPEFKSLVWGYARAHRRHGGDGAFYVFIRSARKRR